MYGFTTTNGTVLLMMVFSAEPKDALI